MSERTQRIFNLSFNSKIPSELKTWEILQKLPRGYGKKLFQSLLEEKFGKSNNPDFEKKMMSYLDLSDFSFEENQVISVKEKNEFAEIKDEKKVNIKSNPITRDRDPLEV